MTADSPPAADAEAQTMQASQAEKDTTQHKISEYLGHPSKTVLLAYLTLMFRENKLNLCRFPANMFINVAVQAK